MIDDVVVKLRAGYGGHGSPAVRALRPFGGDGGRGGDLILEGTAHRYDLSFMDKSRSYDAPTGYPGQTHVKQGADAPPLVIKVPLTTSVYDMEGNLKARISKPGERVVLLKGGEGGYGNKTLQKNPDKMLPGAIKGKEGEFGRFRFIFSLRADVLFIGYPNAGKSSLLNAITNANSKVAAYEFTTISPHLGVAGDLILMDLPGIIQGTFEGRGLGAGFLKHTRAAQLVAHFISLEHDDIWSKYEEIREELRNLGNSLFEIPEIVVLTKADLVTQEDIDRKSDLFKEKSIPFVVTSSANATYSEDVVELFQKMIKDQSVSTDSID